VEVDDEVFTEKRSALHKQNLGTIKKTAKLEREIKRCLKRASDFK